MQACDVSVEHTCRLKNAVPTMLGRMSHLRCHKQAHSQQSVHITMAKIAKHQSLI
jgi:hypothetical protein